MKPSLKSLLLSFALLPFSPLLHAQDANADSLLLSGFEEPLNDQWRSNNANSPAFTAELDPEKVKEGSSSGKWEAAPTSNPWLFLKNAPTDWSAYEGLSVWLYSENGNGQIVNLVVNSGEGYYLHQVHVDWQGWKEVVVPFTDFKSPRPVNGWSDVSSLMISLKGYGQEAPLEDTRLYFDELRLIRR